MQRRIILHRVEPRYTPRLPHQTRRHALIVTGMTHMGAVLLVGDLLVLFVGHYCPQGVAHVAHSGGIIGASLCGFAESAARWLEN